MDKSTAEPAAPDYIKTSAMIDAENDDQIRFEAELEFVQCLANPHYLHFLAKAGYFEDKRFRAYIVYLQYFRRPQYVKYVKYPYCIRILELLLDDTFVKTLSNQKAIEAIEQQLMAHWICFKRGVQRLEENLKWMEDVKDVRQYVDTEANLTLSNKLDTLADLKRCPQNASKEETGQYMMRTLNILDQMLPLIRRCTREFKHTYIMDNAFVRYVVGMTVTHRNLISKEALTMALNFVVALESPAIYDVLLKLINALRLLPNTVNLCLDHCNNLLLLLENTGATENTDEVCNVALQLLFQALVEGIDIDALAVTLSVLSILHQKSPDEKQLEEITSLYMNEVKSRIFTLEPAAMLNLLQFMYRCAYVDDELYKVTMEAFIYTYNLMSHEEKSTLLLLLPFLKHMYLLTTPNISTNIYSEECQMLNSMLRREFENKIEHMSFDDMITHSLAISLMFKQSGVVRKLLLKTINKDMIGAISGRTFLKLLSCCNTLHITSSSIDVSRLLSKAAHAKLAESTGTDMLHGFKCLAQIAAHRHRKYLVPLVYDILEKNKTDCLAIIECLHLYVSLRMQRVNLNVLETGFALLFPHLKLQIAEEHGADFKQFGGVDDMLTRFGSNGLLPPEDGAQGSMPTTRRRKKDSDVLYIGQSESVADAIPLRGLIKLLDCLTKMELELAQMIPIFGLIQTSILKRVKYNSSVSFYELAEVLKSLTESRVVCSELADVILDRVCHCPERLDDPESAATILQFIEFTGHGDCSSKLSQPLFEFCLRKPTTPLMELLEYQRYKRPDFHAAYTELMKPVSTDVPDGLGGVIKHAPVLGSHIELLEQTVKLPRATTGKSHQALKDWLTRHFSGESFEEYYKIDNLVVDFFCPNLGTAVQILKSQDCYCDGQWVHLKSRMWLLCEILRLKGIRIILIPERGLKAVSENVGKMVLKAARNTGGGDDVSSDSSLSSDENNNMTDFQREMMLAEKHAEKVRKRQRENLLNKAAPIERPKEKPVEVEEGMILEDTPDRLPDNNIGNDFMYNDDVSANVTSTLFEDEVEQVAQVPVTLLNKARISKTRALHILEHPNCSNYLAGTVAKILVKTGTTPDSVGSQYPSLVNSHAIFKVERLVKTKEYPVYGSNMGNDCDHQIQEFLGKAGYNLMGRILTDRRSDAISRVGLNEICSAPITQDEVKFGGESIVCDLERAAANLRNFTFTDEDVRIILERKLFKESMEDGEFQGGRGQLIAAIQRISHEIELLTELVKTDVSKIEHLRALEARKAKLDEKLSTMKATSRNPIFVKNCPVLRANAEPSRGGAIRKTTQPTPMIIFNNPGTQDVFANESRKRERRTIGEMSYEEQKDLVLTYIKHMGNPESNNLDRKANIMDHDGDGWTNQNGLISLEAYCNMN
ncbi:Mediator of RNA polymerase II transcription subunit 31 [Babesia sp. Xinjiang]|uniref:Mediator of RNA polymerase II transcription subunit 31 n=1 Tax=Babesia sp. Xinjiang TaxID=462227 RepID=UPI000A22A816|nr:Mediator of RNA polymerase II transcription subunit 31 [Babesia sp. Xinjiang]ORM41095.1 Mediator of RNA polymerase II transcription subunit 31 [Babesia sp. Xinjiang]